MLAILAICVIGSIFAFINENRGRSKLSSEASARITRTDVRRDVDPETGKEFSKDVLVTFDYEIHGIRYTRTVRKGKVESLAFIPWGKAKVCYDHDDPTSHGKAFLIPNDGKCG